MKTNDEDKKSDCPGLKVKPLGQAQSSDGSITRSLDHSISRPAYKVGTMAHFAFRVVFQKPHYRPSRRTFWHFAPGIGKMTIVIRLRNVTPMLDLNAIRWQTNCLPFVGFERPHHSVLSRSEL